MQIQNRILIFFNYIEFRDERNKLHIDFFLKTYFKFLHFLTPATQIPHQMHNSIPIKNKKLSFQLKHQTNVFFKKVQYITQNNNNNNNNDN